MISTLENFVWSSFNACGELEMHQSLPSETETEFLIRPYVTE